MVCRGDRRRPCLSVHQTYLTLSRSPSLLVVGIAHDAMPPLHFRRTYISSDHLSHSCRMAGFRRPSSICIPLRIQRAFSTVQQPSSSRPQTPQTLKVRGASHPASRPSRPACTARPVPPNRPITQRNSRSASPLSQQATLYSLYRRTCTAGSSPAALRRAHHAMLPLPRYLAIRAS